MELTKEYIAYFISECLKDNISRGVYRTDRGSKENPYYHYVPSEIYNDIKTHAPDILDDKDMYYVSGDGYAGWVQLLVLPDIKLTTAAYGKIGRVNKPTRQEFMDAKYKHKNFAKDYLMKGKKW